MRTLKSIFLLKLMFVSVFCFGQLTFVTNNYTKPMSSVTDLSSCETKDFGFTFSNNATVSKYDKITYVIYQRPKNSTEEFKNLSAFTFSSVSIYPKKKRNENKKEFNICIICEDSQINGLIYYNDICERMDVLEYIDEHEYKIYVLGYYIDGYEEYWDEHSKSFRTKTFYDVPEVVYTSDIFSFKTDDNTKQKQNEFREFEDKHKQQYDKIKEKYLKVVDVPYLVNVQPRKEIFDAYELLLEDLLNKKDYVRIQEVNNKLLSIDKKYKKLKKSLKGKTDTNKILEIILGFSG